MKLTKIWRNIKHKSKLISTCRFSTVSNKNWESVVGLEVHAQLNTESKLFSGSQNVFGGAVNNCVSLFDAAIPGTLPVLNRKCVELGIITALALSCKVNEVSTFDRKHYFYADLPAGYQITQQRAPLACDGAINFQVYTVGIHKQPYKKISKIKQIQLEQDSGKSLHDEEAKISLVDLNRAGVPLIELVFEPDLEDGEEAAALVKELTLILQRLGACTGLMEKGALRVDANVSIRRPGDPLSTRTEIKNISSVGAVSRAIKYEIHRQKTIVENGGQVVNETRAWDGITKTTIAMRDKEVVQDYRFMPEPNLPPLRVNLKTRDDHNDILSVPLIKDKMPELPEDTRQYLIKEFQLRPENAIRLVNEPKLLEYFQELTVDKNENRCPIKVANLLLNDLLTVINMRNLQPNDCPITVDQLKQLTDLLLKKDINLDIWKKVNNELISLSDSNLSPLDIIKDKGWVMISDEEEITKMCLEVINNNPKLVKQYKNGKTQKFFTLVNMLRKNSDKEINMSIAAKVMGGLLKK